MNLSNALNRSSNVVIRCGTGDQAIDVTRTHTTRGNVVIDGEGRTTLSGMGTAPLFAPSGTLTLRNITVRNPRPGTPTIGGGSIAAERTASIVLENVITEHASAAYIAATLSATNSEFSHNGDPSAENGSNAVIDSDTVTLLRSVFKQNFEPPIAGGAVFVTGRPALSRHVEITDSTFTENHAPLLLQDAQVFIRTSRFNSNGTAAPAGSLAFACCAGAITLVHSRAQIAGSTFFSNQSAGFGGAIYALGSSLELRNSNFEHNTARSGGAVAYWGRPVTTNIWSDEPFGAAPQLTIARTEFKDNSATGHGGALLWLGLARLDAALFSKNHAGGVGGAIAHWRAAPEAEPFQAIVSALEDLTGPADDQLIASRGILVDNLSNAGGAALAGGPALVRLGNSLIARNSVNSGSSGAAVVGGHLELINATIADNHTSGLSSHAGSLLNLLNVVITRNDGTNCDLQGAVLSGRNNLQYPNTSCGGSTPSRDPGLTNGYEPGTSGAANGAGDVTACLTNPLVGGVDLKGRPRLADGRCAIGALELAPPPPLMSGLPFGLGLPQHAHFLFFLLLFLLLLVFWLTFWTIWRKRIGRSHRPKVPAA